MKKCFVISPIGEEGSDIRKNANHVFNYIIKPAMNECGFLSFRSDHLNKPGKISEQMLQEIHQADLCIVDLTNHNPNVFYELAIAQSANRPVIILIKKGEVLPFDVKDLRCIYYDFDPDALSEKTYVNQVINYIKEFELTGWKIKDLFKEYRTISDSQQFDVVDYDDIKNQVEKTIVYKMINLKSIDLNPEVVYERYIPRINKKIAISSEFMAIRINKFDRPVSHMKSRDRTSGEAIEVNAWLPFHLQLEDTDKRATLIEPLIIGPSNVYVATAHTYNGFKTGDLDISTKAERNTEIMRLIVDFSSIPNYDKMISDTPKLFYRHFQHNSNELINETLNYKMIAQGIFLAEKRNMRKEEVLRFEFSINELILANN